MIVRVIPGIGPRLDEPEDFKGFKVVVEGGLAGETLQLALGPAGRLDGEHVWIAQDWLEQASGLVGDAHWQAGLAGMLGYAEKKGWLEPGTGAVRGHIERPSLG